MIRVATTDLESVLIIEPDVFDDARGEFSETFSEREFAAAVAPFGLPPVHFVQDNESRSHRNVIRGLHFQKEPHAQAKLVRVVKGHILDVVLDMRRSSATFGKWIAVELSAENRRQLFIPRGFAHGFRVPDRETVVLYKTDNYYAPDSGTGVRWDDPSLRIPWGIARKPIISPQDAALPLWADAYYFE